MTPDFFTNALPKVCAETNTFIHQTVIIPTKLEVLVVGVPTGRREVTSLSGLRGFVHGKWPFSYVDLSTKFFFGRRCCDSNPIPCDGKDVCIPTEPVLLGLVILLEDMDTLYIFVQAWERGGSKKGGRGRETMHSWAYRLHDIALRSSLLDP